MPEGGRTWGPWADLVYTHRDRLEAVLTPKQMEVVTYRYLHDPCMTLRQVAARLGISTNAVYSREVAAMERLGNE